MSDDKEGFGLVFDLVGRMVEHGLFKGGDATEGVCAAIERIKASMTAAESGAAAMREEWREIDERKRGPMRAADSIQKDIIVCMECGKSFKSLAPHLLKVHGMTADVYKAKWRIEAGAALVARAYGEKRREIAQVIGLGAAGREAKAARELAQMLGEGVAETQQKHTIQGKS